MNPFSPPGQPRLQDIAEALGLSKSTVSLALRGSPKVNAKTAERVRAEAERLHYRPDPLLSAFSSRRHKHALGEYRATIAILWAQEHRGTHLHPSTVRAFQNFGYRTEDFHRNNYPTAERLGKVLRARGIPAILVPEHPEDLDLAGFPWEDFVAIQCGIARTELPIDIIRYNPFDCMRLAWQKLRGLGCRRIGAMIPSHASVKSVIEEKQTAAYYYYRDRDVEDPADRIPSLEGPVSECMTQVPAWMARYRPDAVIGPWDGFYHAHEDLLRPSATFRGYIAVRADEQNTRVAGFLVVTRLLELAALNHLHHRLRDLPSETGNTPRFSIVVEPTWKPGDSLRE